MSVQSDVIQKLVALNTAVGSKVYDEQVPQGLALPFMATTELSGSQPTTLDGRALFNRTTIRIAVFSRSASERDSISTVIAQAFRNFKGQMGETRVAASRLERSADEVALSDGDNLIKGKGLDLFLTYY